MAATEEVSARGFNLPLAAKFFLGCAFLIAFAVGVAVFVTYAKGNQAAARAVDSALATSSAVQKEFDQNRLDQLQLKVRLFAADSSTAKYVAQVGGSAGSLPGLSEGGERDTQSIADLLKERQEQYGYDLAIVMDARGNVLGRSDQTEAFREALADDAFVRVSIARIEPLSGYWRQRDRLYQAAIMPLQQDQNLVGFVLLAQNVNNELCRQIAKLSGAQIAYWMPPVSAPGSTKPADGDKRLLLAASSLDDASAKELQSAVATQAESVPRAIGAGQSLPRVPLSFSGQSWIAQLAPTAEGEASLGGLLSLTSTDVIVATYRDVQNWVIGGGIVAIIIALLLSYAMAKGILRPVRTMAEAAEQAAAGNYKTRLAMRGSDELARLSHAFDSLLSDLREKSDMEGYVGNLSRFLPDPGAEAVRAAPAAPAAPAPRAPARIDSVAVLGLEFRQFGKRDVAQSAEQTLTSFDTLARVVADCARAAGGTSESMLGPRFALTFRGATRHSDALQAWLSLLDSLRTATMDAPAGALVSGDAVLGDTGVDQVRRPALLGAVMLQLDRLLPDAAPGQLLLARGSGEEIKTLLGGEALAVATGVSSAKRFYVLADAALARLDEIRPKRAQPVDETDRETIVSGSGRAQPVAAMTPRTVSRLAATLDIGSVFGGRYRILAELGSGGMGVVYKAHDMELGDVVALKMLKPGMLVDAEQLERLKSEIRLARRITHPNVLRTFDFGEVDGRPYISMEYVRGLTLRYLLNETRRMPYSAGLRISRQLCAGLTAAHEVGVLHRDIKPENLILEQTGNAKLMDFGIARPLRRGAPDHTQPGTFVGTPHYSAPEQLAGEEVDQRADIYSSGVLMCEMFCGKLPYSGSNTLEIYIAQMQQAPIKPSEFWPEIPSALEAIILRCLCKVPAERYQSASDLAQALATLRA